MFSCYTIFMLHFFHFRPSLLTRFLFYSFHGVLFAAIFRLTSHFLYYTLLYYTFYITLFCITLFILHSSVSHSFHVAIFISSTFLVFYFFHNALSHGNLLIILCCGLLRLHFFVLRFSHVAHFHFYCIFFILHFTRLYFLLVIFSESIYNPFLSWVLNERVIRTQI